MTRCTWPARESDDLPVVLKVLDASGRRPRAPLALHPGVRAAVAGRAPERHSHLRQGFTDDHAYIAMEYFAARDLRAEIGADMGRRARARDRRAAARRWAAIHQRGVDPPGPEARTSCAGPTAAWRWRTSASPRSMLRPRTSALTQHAAWRSWERRSTSPRTAAGQVVARVRPVQPRGHDVELRRANGPSSPSRWTCSWRAT